MPGVIGTLLMARTKRLLGARVSTLFGNPFNFRVAGSGTTLSRAMDLAHRNQLARRFHQPRSDPADPVACQFTAAMRRGHENYAADFWSMPENERLLEEVFAFRRQLRLLGRLSKNLQP